MLDLHPTFRIGRLRRVERHRLAGLGQRRIVLVGDFAQRLLGAGELALGLDHCGGVGIVRGLGFLHVRDRNQAHVVALVGLFELLGDRVRAAWSASTTSWAASTLK